MVGDIVKIQKNDPLPADVFIFKSSEDKNNCFVETKSLDGETNLKEKKISTKVREAFPEEDKEIYKINHRFNFERPNPYLYSFQGNLELKNGDRIPIDNSMFILRGSVVRNTEWVYGIVAYNGHETKIMLNSIPAQAKMSLLEHKMNTEIILLCIVQATICISFALLSVGYQMYFKQTLRYMEIDKMDIYIVAWYISWPTFLGKWLLILTNFIPISLMVSHEMVKFFQAKELMKDQSMSSDMYGELIHANVQSSSLMEELGQVNYIFSDKTGTLTCNLMEFKKLFAGEISYGETEEEVFHQTVENVKISDPLLFKHLHDVEDSNHKSLVKAARFLGLCHTAFPEKEVDDLSKLKYCAASPDELALVNFARYCDYIFMRVDEEDNYILRVKGKEEKHKLLNILEFNSTRKRMSVILEDEQGAITIYTKGADSIIIKRLHKGQERILENLSNNLNSYGAEGLRTLMLAQKTITKEEYKKWEVEWTKASSSMTDREKKMMDVMEQIENELEIVGATAIEDRLQPEVPETISLLLKADIKLWVLTGDKVETAMTIAQSTHLTNSDTCILTLDGDTIKQLKFQINEAKNQMRADRNGDFSVFVTGDALIQITEHKLEKELLLLAEQASSFVACRVSPKQKQEIVAMVRKENPKARTLSIGDGANDVNMIAKAHIGIGIKGLEGSQAARASDIAIGEFKLLRRLVLGYGRECYRKNCDLVGYFFYKNSVLVFPQLWIGVFTGFSGQTVYEPTIFEGYNIFFTAIPILIYAIYDLEIPFDFLENEPEHYWIGLENKMFNRRKLWTRWMGRAAIHSLIICVFSFLMIEFNFQPTGKLHDFWTNGMGIFSGVVLVANVELFTIHNQHSLLTYSFIGASVLSYVLALYLFSEVVSNPLYLCFEKLFRTPTFYIFLISSVYICNQVSASILKIKSALTTVNNIREKKQKKISHEYKRNYTGFAFSG